MSESAKTLVIRITRKFRFIAAVFALLLLIIFWLAAYTGYLIGMDEAVVAKAENIELKTDLAASIDSERNARQRATRAEKTAEIDRLAAERVRQELLTYRKEVADLEADLAFYRRLMAPDELEKGLGLYAFKVSLDQQTDQYRYSAVVTQAGGKNQVIKGSVAIYLLAREITNPVADPVTDPEQQAEAEPEAEQAPIQRIAISDLPDFAGSSPAKLRFRFFQTVEGAFKLPENLSPVSIAIEIKSTGKSAQQLEKTFPWHQLIGER